MTSPTLSSLTVDNTTVLPWRQCSSCYMISMATYNGQTDIHYFHYQWNMPCTWYMTVSKLQSISSHLLGPSWICNQILLTTIQTGLLLLSDMVGCCGGKRLHCLWLVWQFEYCSEWCWVQSRFVLVVRGTVVICIFCASLSLDETKHLKM